MDWKKCFISQEDKDETVSFPFAKGDEAVEGLLSRGMRIGLHTNSLRSPRKVEEEVDQEAWNLVGFF